MSYEQIAAFAIVGTMMAFFVWDRYRYDLVAMVALFASVIAGIVPAKEAFSGFSDDVVIIVAAALVVSAAVARSGIAEVALRPLAPYLKRLHAQVFVLVLAVTLLSTFIKNVGALAILIPVALQLAKRTGTAPSQLLMPLAFGSLLGGLITLIGTSPNIIVARVRQELGGEPFAMFDYAPVGAALALAGLAWITLTCGFLPKRTGTSAGINAAINIEDYVVEARVPAASPVVGQAPHEVEALSEGQAKVTKVVRDEHRSVAPHPELKLKEGDVILMKGDPEDLERAIARGGLSLPGEEAAAEKTDPKEDDEIGVVEGVVTVDSMLVRSTPVEIDLRRRFGMNLIAISRSGQDLTQRLRSVRFRAGDVVVLQGRLLSMPEALKDLGILPLAQREVALGRTRQRWLPLAVLAGAMITVALELLPVAVAFFGAALVLLLAKSISLREVYETVEWPIIVLLGALIPISEAVRTTGASDIVAGWLSHLASALPAIGALALVLVAAMAVTPFLNNAATVLMMAPIASSLAKSLGLNVDPFLMAVAVGAACDFLTPFGHQCNTLVMGPGGYRFGDYWKFGLPLSVLVVLVGVPSIAWIWKLNPA